MAHKATLTTKLGTRPFHIECSCNGTGGDFFDKESALQYMRLHAQRVKQSSGQDVEMVDKTAPPVPPKPVVAAPVAVKLAVPVAPVAAAVPAAAAKK